MKRLLGGLFLVLLSAFVSAFVDVKVAASQNDFTTLVFNCNDADCASVSPFTGTIVLSNGSLVSGAVRSTNGSIIVRFPSPLASPNGYAVYFVSKGFLPMAFVTSLYNNGGTNVVSTNFSLAFGKKDVCKPLLSQLALSNDVQANTPVLINSAASIDSTTASGFVLVNQKPKFVPQEFKNEFYSADVRVTLDILDAAGQSIATQVKHLTNASGNPVFASSSVPVQFSHIPTSAGEFTARVTSEVVDDQCTSAVPASISSTFTVRPEPPRGECNALIVNARLNDTAPGIGSLMSLTFGTIANLANGTGSLTPIQSELSVLVHDGSSVLLNVSRQIVLANPDAVNVQNQSFVFALQRAATHRASVLLAPNSILCNALNKTQHQVNLSFDVADPLADIFAVQFQVTNAVTGDPVDNAVVVVNGTQKATGSQGTVSFDLSPGNFTAVIQKTGFSSVTRTVQVAGDKIVAVLLLKNDTPDATPGNRPPSLNLPDSLNLTSQGTILDVKDFANDAEDEERLLFYNVSGNTNINITFESGIANIVPINNFVGADTVIFTVQDSGNLTANDTVVITINGANTAPSIALPNNLTLAEDTTLNNALFLPDFAADPDTPKTQLAFSIAGNTNPRVGASIDAQNNLDLAPEPDFFGTSALTIRVSDGNAQAQANMNVIVTNVNDAPLVVRILSFARQNETRNLTANLGELFLDVDNDVLNFSVASSNPNVTGRVQNNNLTVEPSQGFRGLALLNITARDPSRANVTLANVLVDMASVSTPPFISPVVPNLTTIEDQQNGFFLTPFEHDFEQASAQLFWNVSDVNASLANVTVDPVTDFLLVTPA